MRSLLSLLLRLAMALSLGATSLAHATEARWGEEVTYASPAMEAAAGHVAGDGDEVRADAEKGYPHHHGGCHGDHAAAPLATCSLALRPRATSAPTAAFAGGLRSTGADPALRPPQA